MIGVHVEIEAARRLRQQGESCGGGRRVEAVGEEGE